MSQITLNPVPFSTVQQSVPVNGLAIPSNAQFGQIQFVMPNDSERANSSQRLEFGIEVQAPGSTGWKAYLQAGWDGGTGATAKNSTVLNPPPTATVGGDFFQAFGGGRVRIAIKLREPMTLGGTLISSRFV